MKRHLRIQLRRIPIKGMMRREQQRMTGPRDLDWIFAFLIGREFRFGQIGAWVMGGSRLASFYEEEGQDADEGEEDHAANDAASYGADVWFCSWALRGR